MVKFLHLADLHLGALPAYLGEYANERANDFFDSFTRCIDYALEEKNGINFIVISGDFFDSPTPNNELVGRVLQQLSRVKKTKTPVIVTPGNHDGISYPNCVYLDDRFKLYEYIKLIQTPNPSHNYTFNVYDEKIHIYGMAWDFKESIPPFDEFVTLDDEGYHIAVIHGTISGVTFSDLHSREVPLDIKKLSKIGLDYVALGHIHSNSIIDKPGLFAVYPGTLEGRRFTPNEEGDRYLCVVSLEKNKKPTIEKKRWNKKQLFSITINISQEVVECDEDIIALIRKKYSGQDKIAKIKMIGETSFVIDVEKVVMAVQHDFSWVMISDETSLFDSTTIESWAKEDTIRGVFVKRLREMYESSHDEIEKKRLTSALRIGITAFKKSMGG